MTTLFQRSWMRRGISLFVAVVFTMTTLTGSLPQAAAFAGVEDLAIRVRTHTELQKDLFAIPAELGALVSSWEPPVGTSSHEFVVHIQDAHANPEAQQNIAGILKFLMKKYPDLKIGVEGAAGPLHPEYLQFFKEYPEADQAVVEDLRQKGELGGTELFLLEQNNAWGTGNGEREVSNVHRLPLSEKRAEDRKVEAMGVEDIDLYRENLKTYRELLFKRDAIQTRLDPIRAKLEADASRGLNAGLRNFLKERKRRKEGKFYTNRMGSDPDLQAYIGYLNKQASRKLQIDLKDPIEQLRFPNLMRVILAAEVQKGFDLAKVREDWKSVLAGMKKASQGTPELESVRALELFGYEKGMISALPDGSWVPPATEAALYPRKLLEQLFLFSRDYSFSFADHGSFLRSFELLVLQAEAEVVGLLEEMNSLEGMFIEKLATTGTEKEMVSRLDSFDLLEKLLFLELSREEYSRIVNRRDAMMSFVKNSPELEGALSRAYHFYGTTIQRDRALVENVLALGKGNDGKHKRILVLITGGFHTEGINTILRGQRTGYVTLTPHISRTDRGALYQKVMAGDHADLSAYFKVKNPFATKQEALLFREMIEVATPVLSKKYRMKPTNIAAAVAKTVQAHPVLSSAVAAQSYSDDRKILRFTPRTLTPQNTAIPSPAILGDVSFLRSLIKGDPGVGAASSNVTFGQQPALAMVPPGAQVGYRTIAAQRSEMRTGERAPPVVSEKPVPAEDPVGEKRFKGTATSGGTVRGRPVIFSRPRNSISWSISTKDTAREKGEYDQWYKRVHKWLDECLPSADDWGAIIQKKKNEWQPVESGQSGLQDHLIARIVKSIGQFLDADEFAKLQKDKRATALFRMILEDQTRLFALEVRTKEKVAEMKDAKKFTFFKEQQKLAKKILLRKLKQVEGEREAFESRLRVIKEKEEQLADLRDQRVQLPSDSGDQWGELTNQISGILSELKGSNRKDIEISAARAQANEEIFRAQLKMIQALTFDEFVKGGLLVMTPIMDEIRKTFGRLPKNMAPENEHAYQMDYDTGRLLRDVIMDLVKASEAKLSDFKVTPVEKTEKESGQDAVVLVIDQPVIVQEVMDERKKWGGRIAGVWVGWGGRGSHWVELASGMEEAPPFFCFTDDRDKGLALRELRDEEEVVFHHEESRGWSLVMHPTKATLEGVQTAQDGEKLIEEEERRLLLFPVDVDVQLNLVTHPMIDLNATGAQGAGLIRTDILSEEAQNYLIEVAREIAEGKFKFKEFFTQLHLFGVQKMTIQEFVAQILKDQNSPGAENIRRLLSDLINHYGAFIQHPFFRGKEVPFRTLDLQDDSKGKELLRALIAIAKADPEKRLLTGIPEDVANDENKLMQALRGFDLYRKTSIRKFFLVLQIAAFLMAYSHYLDQLPKHGASSRRDLLPKLRIFFPMVASVADVNYIHDEILPAAKAFAAMSLSLQAVEPLEGLQRASEKINRVVQENTQFGIMVEILDTLKDEALTRTMVRDNRNSFFKVGTNDLEAQIAQDILRRPVGRDDEDAQAYFGRLSPPLKKVLDLLFGIVLQETPEKDVCICGALGFDPVFQLYVEYWRRKGLKISVSGKAGNVLSSHHRFLLYKMIPQAELDHLFESNLSESDFEEAAQLLARKVMENATPFLVRAASFQRRYQEAGFLQGFYSDLVDPSRGIGSFQDILTLYGFLLTAEGKKAPEIDALMRDISARGLFPSEMHGIIDRLVQRGTIPDSYRKGVLETLSFLQQAWNVHRGMALKNPRKFEFGLAGTALTEFINTFEGKKVLPWLSQRGSDAERRKNFYEQYFRNINHIRNLVFIVIHERYQELYGEEVKDLLKVMDFQLEGQGKGDISGWDGEIWVRKRGGMMAVQDGASSYKNVRELALHVTFSEEDRARLEKLPEAERRTNEAEIFQRAHARAVEYFRGHPSDIAKIFGMSGWHGDHEVRISYPLRQTLREAIGAYEDEDMLPEMIGSQAKTVEAPGLFLKLFQDNRDISYPVWRMYFFGFLSKFFPGFRKMLDHFQEDNRKLPLHMQTLNAFKFVEELPKNNDFMFRRAQKVFDQYHEDQDTLAMFRITLLVLGIIRADSKTPTEREIQLKVKQILGALGAKGLEKEFGSMMTWLIRYEMSFQDRDLMTSREIENALSDLFDPGGGMPTAKELDLLYLLIVATRVGRFDQKKMVMLKSQGPDSALANWDKFYVAAKAFLESKATSGSKVVETLVANASAVVREGHLRIGSEDSLLAEEEFSLWDRFQSYYEEEAHRYQALYRFPEALSQKIKEVATDFTTFQKENQEMKRLMTAYYLGTLDSRRWVTVFLTFLNLKFFEETSDPAVVMSFNPLNHPYKHQTFEVFFTRVSPESELVYARILKERGFNIESVGLGRDKERMIARFVGNFFESDKEPEQVFHEIKQDLEEIFVKQEIRYFKELSRHEPARQSWVRWIKSALGLSAEDETISSDLLRKLHLRFGDLAVERPSTSEMKPDTVVEFIEDRTKKSSGEYSTFLVETEDRPGLTAFLWEFLSMRNIRIVGFYFDDTLGKKPRILIHMSEFGGRKKIPQLQRDYILTHLKGFLDAPRVRVHYAPRDRSFQIETSTPAPTPDEAVPEVSPQVEYKGPVVLELKRQYEIAGEFGLHARPSSAIARIQNALGSFNAILKIEKRPDGSDSVGEPELDMSDMFSLLGGEVKQGTIVTVEIRNVEHRPVVEQEVAAFWKALEAIMDGDEILLTPLVEKSGEETATEGRSEVRENRQPLANPIRKILLVDDLDMIAKILRRDLEEAGFEVEVSNSGVQALERLNTFSPDAILSDVRMPGMTGYEWIRAAVRAQNVARIPIIFMSSDTKEMTGFDKETEELANQYEVHFLEKPFNIEDLIEIFKGPEKYFEHRPEARSEVRGEKDQSRAFDALRARLLEQDGKFLSEMGRMNIPAVRTKMTGIWKPRTVYRDLMQLFRKWEKIRAAVLRDESVNPERIQELKTAVDGIFASFEKQRYKGSLTDKKTLTPLRNFLEKWTMGYYKPTAFREEGDVSNEALRKYIRKEADAWIVGMMRFIEMTPKYQTGFLGLVKTFPGTVLEWSLEPWRTSVDKTKSPEYVLGIMNRWHKFERLSTGELVDRYPRAKISEDRIGAARRRQIFLFVEGSSFMTRAAKRLRPYQVKLPFKEPLGPPQRSELRGGTEAVRKSLIQDQAQGGFDPVKKLVPEADIPSIGFAAEIVGGLYFERSIARGTQDVSQARLWIAMKLIEATSASGIKGQITGARLSRFLENLMASMAHDTRALASRDVATGPQLHVNLAGLEERSWPEFVRNFPVVLGLLVTLRASLSINVEAEGDAFRSIQKQFEDLMSQEGIVLAPRQLRIISAMGSDRFKSFEGQKEADAFMARDEKLLVRRRNVKSYWVTEDGNQMDVLTAGIATALLEVASDEHLNAANTYRPSQYAALLAVVMNAIQGYLRIQMAA